VPEDGNHLEPVDTRAQAVFPRNLAGPAAGINDVPCRSDVGAASLRVADSGDPVALHQQIDNICLLGQDCAKVPRTLSEGSIEVCSLYLKCLLMPAGALQAEGHADVIAEVETEFRAELVYVSLGADAL
jgi:hypothetical protein